MNGGTILVFERKNIYVLNKKDKDAIIYQDSYGNIIRLTVADFANAEEFYRFKEWSDQNYHEEEKLRHLNANHTQALETTAEKITNVNSPEDKLLEQYEEKQWQKRFQQLMRVLTPTQYRRFYLYCICRLSEKRIAAVDNVSQQNVSKSIQAARRKMKHFFEKRV